MLIRRFEDGELLLGKIEFDLQGSVLGSQTIVLVGEHVELLLEGIDLLLQRQLVALGEIQLLGELFDTGPADHELLLQCLQSIAGFGGSEGFHGALDERADVILQALLYSLCGRFGFQ